jgi:C-terminal processing protease CtpA/Prc
MLFHVLVAAAVTGIVMTSTSCAQGEHDVDQETDVLMVSSEKRAWLGVSVENMSDRLARRMNVKTEKGALVNSVSDDSPARKAGIKEDDIIVSFDGKTIDDASDLTHAVANAEPGKSAECVVMRRDDRKKIQVTVEKPPKAMAWTARVPRAPMALVRPGHIRSMGSGMLGLGVIDLNRQLAEYFEIPGGRGVLVSEVDKDGPGATAGLKAGDVIVSMGTADVDDIDDIHWALGEFEKGDTVTVGYVRKGARRSTTVTVDESSNPKIYKFRSGVAPHFDFDFDLEGLRDNHIDLEEMQKELQHAQQEFKAQSQVMKREAERAAREIRRAVRTRTI